MRATTIAGFGAGALCVYLSDADKGRQRRKKLTITMQKGTLAAIRGAKSLRAARVRRKLERETADITIDLVSAAEARSESLWTSWAPPHRGFTRSMHRAEILERPSALTPPATPSPLP